MIDSNIEKHIKTHSQRSAEDEAAVSVLKSFLRSGGRINTNFASNDKWPNSDGNFEFVSDPDISRKPEQNFIVQIKGTSYYREKGNTVCYQLQSLAFPATVAARVSLDPGILFVVLNPEERGEERVFWKYMSVEYVNSIDYTKDSCTVYFNAEEEIENTEESIEQFCRQLEKIIENHSFSARLDIRPYSRKEIEAIIQDCNERISQCIDLLETDTITRDMVSAKIIRLLREFCIAVLLLNASSDEDKKITIQLAWEKSLLDIKTKYLGMFYKALDYIGYRVPEEGQAERLMLKYYDFLWQIRDTLGRDYGIKVLSNLEKFPLKINKLDQEYYESVAEAVDTINPQHYLSNITRFYIHKKTSFYVGEKRYFEYTFQLAGIYATKYNRVTVYSQLDMSTGYSVRITYTDTRINLWGIQAPVKVMTGWEVSIDPVCLNKLAKVLRQRTKISSQYGEYRYLMKFLTNTGMSLLDLIDLRELEFQEIVDGIYKKSNTSIYKEILQKLRTEYASDSCRKGRNVVRYLLLNLREEVLEDVMLNQYDQKSLCNELELSSRCYPFEKNPFISNLPHMKNNAKMKRDVCRITDKQTFEQVWPFLKVKSETMRTGEIYFEQDSLITSKEIKNFNRTVDCWEQKQGICLKQDQGYVYIEEYEQTTISILKKLRNMSRQADSEQAVRNRKFVKEHEDMFSDNMKKKAVLHAFVKSDILLIYGAAGTGKTTLMNYISQLMGGKEKIFLAKTHTALRNLKRRVEKQDESMTFMSADSFCKSRTVPKADIIFIDECSTIDNRIMEGILKKIPSGVLLVLAGDIHQIEAIDFGNWFFYAKELIKVKGASVELTNTWRTEDEVLIDLWNEIRNKKFLITEMLSLDGPFSSEMNGELLEQNEEDEVVLCLNYDGKFGLNNMNSYFQCANKKSEPIEWEEWIYKIGDHILFNESLRFPILHNNLKGIISGIKKYEDKISFTIDVDMLLTKEECRKYDIRYIESKKKTTTIEFDVYHYNEHVSEAEADSMKMKSVVPFQLAYAISIHKAQGLEYDSVKVVIPDSNAEKITHGIFYTAVTRAKKKLKIYWSSETMQEIIHKFSEEPSKKRSMEMIQRKL